MLDEIRATDDIKLRKFLEKLINNFKVLEITKEVVQLTDTYLLHRRLPRGDALHIASACLGDIDFLVTWNLRHIFKRGTQELVHEINTKARISIPMIVTPKEFLEEE